MIIQFISDNNVDGKEELFTQYRESLERGLKRFGDRLARVVVSLSDENAHKEGQNDKRCMMEARLEGMDPIAVTARAGNLNQAVRDAVDKLKSALGSAVEKQRGY
jgi:hypothetical protein